MIEWWRQTGVGPVWRSGPAVENLFLKDNYVVADDIFSFRNVNTLVRHFI